MAKVSPELDQLFESLLGNEKLSIYKQIGKKLPHHIRFNPLKGDVLNQQRFFRELGFRFHQLPGRSDIFQIDYQPYPIGKSLSHFLGHIYVQDIASMLPAILLDPQPGDWVLDMSAAPGSKTTLLGVLMENTGLIVANDIVSKRLRALSKNVERIGLSNVLVYKWYGEQYGNTYFEVFDRILLDPACSGIGTLHKNPEILGWWTPNHCTRLAEIQTNMMRSAVKALRPGGTMIYSTCTLAPVENEAIISAALAEYPLELESVSVDWLNVRPGLKEYQGETFHPDLDKTIRLYPVDQHTEGFYVAKLRKTEQMRSPRMDKRKPPRRIPFVTWKTSPVKKYIDYLSKHFEIPISVFKRYRYILFKEHLFFIEKDIQEFPVFGSPLQIGLPLAKVMDRGAKFTTLGCHLLGHHAKRMTLEIADLSILERFVNREALDIPTDNKGQYIVKHGGLILGYGLADKGNLKSQFPKGDWPFQLIGDWEK